MSYFPPIPPPATSYVIQSQDTYLNATVPMAVIGGGSGPSPVPANLTVSTLVVNANANISTSIVGSEDGPIFLLAGNANRTDRMFSEDNLFVMSSYRISNDTELQLIAENSAGGFESLSMSSASGTIYRGREFTALAPFNTSSITCSTINGVSFAALVSTVAGLSP